IVVVSVAVLLSGAGSGVSPGGVTVAVFVSVPVAAGSTVPVAVNVTVPCAGRLAGVAMLPPPDAAPQVAPPLGADVPGSAVRSLGKTSAICAAVTAVGPLFVTVIV